MKFIAALKQTPLKVILTMFLSILVFFTSYSIKLRIDPPIVCACVDCPCSIPNLTPYYNFSLKVSGIFAFTYYLTYSLINFLRNR